MRYKAEYNCDLDGYVLTFEDGQIAHTQFNIETNKLHADFGEKILERYDEYDTISDDKQDIVDNFVDNFDYSKYEDFK